MRVYETHSGRLLGEYRRGADPAAIYQIVFNRDATKIAVASDKGTVHIFNLETPSGQPVLYEDAGRNRQSSLAFMKDLLPKYFASEWSFAQFHLRDGRCALHFDEEEGNAIWAATFDGYLYRFVFDVVRGGEAVQMLCKPLFD